MQGEVNQRVGDYEILGILGAGGMGRVYRVRNVISDRIEAMKILLPDLAGRSDLADRFLREIKLVASLHHPNIASLCTALTINNQLIMVMEFVDGVTLTQLLERGPIRVPDALNYLDQALAALGYAHGKGIIHRDIKPANMMLTPTGEIKLMDFGIARADTQRQLTQTGTTLGSIDYMSPEQIMGQATDARSDLYSIGVSLYEMVTGQRPFKATSDFELMAAHVKEMPKSPLEMQPWMPARLSEIIMKTIAKAPEDRFQRAEDLRQALRDLPAALPNGFGAGQSPVLTMVEQSTTVPKTFLESRPATIVENNWPAAFAENSRPATMVEAFPSARPQTALLNNAFDDRRMTEVAGTPAYNPQSVALALPKKSNNKLLYAVGGTALALAAAAVPVVRSMHLSDSQKQVETSGATTPTPVPLQQPQPTAPSPVAPSKLTKPPATVGPQPRGTAPAVAPREQASIRGTVVIQPGPQQPARPQLSQEEKDKLDAVETQIDGLKARAASVNASLITMQRSMQQSGMSLRGDMASKQASMNLNLRKAEEAFNAQDPDRATRFANLTEPDLKALETFLGR
ncbi:serine/threonine-protein kinase [Granulicella aggregans]|uniref:non-specific serine/threonine protein kinase n=1 Tax=Granulicella aggregans TaxID=474949 RepID=A0A7W8E2K4_9BACT|nr:serine/threonine-protein kinase [Granulicella aggregans]MBB5056612.1 serine/threonine-protein kinase [Granulicella aggregans]